MQDPDQSPQGVGPDQDPLSHPADEGDGDKELADYPPDAAPAQMKVQGIDHGPRDEQVQDSEDRASRPDQNRAEPLHTPPAAAANRDEAGDSGAGVPALVVTEAEESRRAEAAPQRAGRPADLVIPASVSSLSSGSDGGDMICCDLLSPRSDTFSLTSEHAISRRSEDEDSRSITASSVMSLFHRVQLDPLEKDWMRSCALGKVGAQRLLLAQEPGLVLKKDFITTALHWAAKQGRQEAVDMMLRSGADVNARSGYTPLHLASIHGHEDIVQTLISTYNAKTNIRDYHGKTAIHYWEGSTDIFTKPDCQPGGRFLHGQRTQRFAMPSFRLSRSRSHGQLHLKFGTLPQTTSHSALDLQL